MADLNFHDVPDPGDRYEICESLGVGVCGEVFAAIDNQASGKRVAIKIQSLSRENVKSIQEEYRVLKDLSEHPNLPDFYGIYRRSGKPDQIWLVMELCEGGSVADLARALVSNARRMTEEHIAFILKETIKALNHLHEHQTIHRDVKASNILLTKEGEVKLVDFGLCRQYEGEVGELRTSIGSPCWMAPEVVTAGRTEESSYGNRADVWALGITAIELGDGKAPFQDVHPTRVLFMIMRNPPPGLYRPANWSQSYNDFITECLEKNPEHRPFMVELLEHPFFTELPENDFHLTQELKKIIDDCKNFDRNENKPKEVMVTKNYLKNGLNSEPELMYVEDLAAIEQLSEDTVLDELQHRMKFGQFYTFIGDVLLCLNPNENREELYTPELHVKYQCKSRCDNSPHIYAVADSAHQDMLHHEEAQHILLAGESYSGKTTNFLHLLKHLTFLGMGNHNTGDRILRAVEIIHCATQAGTPINPNSTRCVLQTQLTFGTSGKVSGAIFWLYQLEKWRVSSTDMTQANFHLFYEFYDFVEKEGSLDKYKLNPGRKYRYLRIPEQISRSQYIRDDPCGNVDRFRKFKNNLDCLEISKEQQDMFSNILAAILVLGDVRFKDGGNGKTAEIENPDVAKKVAELLQVDEKKFTWALINYCYVDKEVAKKRHHTADEARDARDVLSSTIYGRLIDWLINNINYKLSFGRAVYGDVHSISILDMFGFECNTPPNSHGNRFEQLLINCLNEQMQYHYNQRMFQWEMQEMEEEQVPMAELKFYDNKQCVDQLLGKPDGLWYIIDEATKMGQGAELIIDMLKNKKSSHLIPSGNEFAIAHYTGRVTYDPRDLSDKNRDFLPPEMIETLRLTTDTVIVKQLFTNQLTKSGNLTIAVEKAQEDNQKDKKASRKSKWGAALAAEKPQARKYNTLSRGQYSQTRKMRTAGATFRATSLEILKTISIGGGSGATHFVRCIRSDLENNPRGFQPEVIRQQLRAMAILDTARARQKGFPHRIAFQEFIRRYKFLAFDFDENVEMTKDNCRLLLIRLKLEGWLIGNTKVFLKYYNEEYLSRLYELQVKKIVKVQCMMRAFLAKRNVATKLKKMRQDSVAKEIKRQESKELTEEGAALVLQKAYRGFTVRKQFGPLLKTTGTLDEDTADFMRHYCRVWKCKSIFQILLHYRAKRHQDLVYFSQQVHIFNQAVMSNLTDTNNCIHVEKIDPNAKAHHILGEMRPAVWKLPFRLDQVPFFDTSYLCDPLSNPGCNPNGLDSDQESWDEPLRRRTTVSSQILTSLRDNSTQTCVNVGTSPIPVRKLEQIYKDVGPVDIPYCRDPKVPIRRLPPSRQFTADDPPHCDPNTERYSSMSQYSRYNQDTDFDDNISLSSNRSASYKKRPAPAAPVIRAPPPPARIVRSATPSSKSNPIKELQQLGRNHHQNDNQDEDNPPFNFQGMLRKTKYNRASMKRGEQQLSNYNRYDDDQEADLYIDSSRQNVVYHSGSSNHHSNRGLPRPKSCQGIVEHDDMFDYSRESSHERRNSNYERGGIDRKWSIDSDRKISTTEIAPGIIMEGYVEDL